MAELRKVVVRTWVASFVLGLAGCAAYEDRPIDAKATAQDWNQRSLADEGLHQFLTRVAPQPPPVWPQPEWNLDQLTLAALYFQPSLEVARAQIEVARAAVRTAGQRPNPTVTASATYDSTTPPPWIPAVSFDVPIETAGKRGHRLAAAEQNADAARWSWRDQAWQVRVAVRSALLNLYHARESRALLDVQLKARREIVRLLEGQLRAGAVAPTEVASARISLRTDELAEQQADQTEMEALENLADAVGLPNAVLSGTRFSFSGLDQVPEETPSGQMQLAAVLRRADIRGALAAYAAAQSDLQLEIANQYPDIHLGPGYELDQTDNKWTLGLTLPLPLLNRNEGPIAEAEARRRLAAAQFVATQAKALNEVAAAVAACESSRRQWRTASDLLHEQQQRRASIQDLLRAGDAEPVTVATAEVEYAIAAVVQLDALVKVQEAFGKLEAATQSPAAMTEDELRAAEETSATPARGTHEK
ncbi:MAG TPA: TolC family protein [Candidatus Didemnitutus sp.]|nr:TolC family protein [Candidatus Didemnitutus sp.]